MNEEEIKVKYILPWLAGTGVQADEIQLECSFNLKIGKNMVVSSSPERERDSVGARLDILVRRGERNLLIVETKAEELALTDDDRDQAISYARLVHPIAPYAVVTNGREFRLYDCLTKQLIEPGTISIRGFDVSFPNDAIEEAQELFLCSTKENLLAFCRAQVNSELTLVKGALSELDKKYIPELHVARAVVSDAIKILSRSDQPGLILTGESGQGKTCNVCWAVEQLLHEGRPALFFNGLHIERDIAHAIAAEFSWAFGGTDNEIAILKRLATLTRGEPLTIVVDGIDEWICSSRVQHLSQLIAAAKTGKFKLILSCKSSVINEFLAIRGTPTHTKQLTEVVNIPVFSDREFFAAIDKYRRAYAFTGAFEDTVLQEAKTNPFLLRVLFDVAHNSNVKHLTFSSVEFFESYYKRLLEKTSDSRRAETILKAIAGHLYEQNADWLLENELRKRLGLNVNEEIMSDLFHGGVLVRGDLKGASTIGFYFQQLRDYIISFKAINFHSKTDGAFQTELSRVAFPSMRGDVIALYYRLASLSHRQILDGRLRENAKSYLDLYVSIIDSEFPAIRSKFRPNTEGGIGFIGELFLKGQSLGAYGFRKIRDNDETIYFYPVNNILERSNLGHLNGADWLHFNSTSNGFVGKVDVAREVVNNEVLEQLRSLVTDGNLYELNYPALLAESILQTVQLNKEIFKPLFENTVEGIRFPLSLNQVKESLWREKLYRHYHDELISEKRRQGTIAESWDGSYVSFSVSLTESEYAQIEENVELAIKSGTKPVIQAKYLNLDQLESFLLPRIEAMITSTGEIAKPIFATESKLKQECFRNEPISIDLAKIYFFELYTQFLEAYKVVIETNFPTLKELFPLYASMPVSVLLYIEPTYLRGPLPMTSLNVYFVKSKGGQSSVEVIDTEPVYGADQTLIVNGISYELLWSSNSTIEQLFQSSYPRTNLDGMMLRKLLYRQIQGELSAVEKALREKYCGA